MSGESTMKDAVLISPEVTTAPVPAFTIAAPTRPPTRACEELEGRPRYQVVTFQPIAPTRQARMTYTSTTCGSTMPLPIVFATETSKVKAATKLKKAAQATA